jgi:hypothetical protein
MVCLSPGHLSAAMRLLLLGLLVALIIYAVSDGHVLFLPLLLLLPFGFFGRRRDHRRDW